MLRNVSTIPIGSNKHPGVRSQVLRSEVERMAAELRHLRAQQAWRSEDGGVFFSAAEKNEEISLPKNLWDDFYGTFRVTYTYMNG